MEKSAKEKPLFIGLSCLSLGCLVGSFAYPLQKMELYHQTDQGQFDIQYAKTYIITEDDLNLPYGFQKDKAKKFAQVHIDYKIQKILLLALAVGCSMLALSMYEVVPNAEIEDEVFQIKAKGKKELLLEAVKHRMAMASKAQRSLFHDELKALMEEYGSSSLEEEILEADEINASYAEWGESSEEDTQAQQAQEIFRPQFPESMDVSSWKACLKGLSDGASREEIIKEILGGGEAADNYFKFLKEKYL